MRMSQDQECSLVSVVSVSGQTGGWFQVVETMGRDRSDDGTLTGRPRPAGGQKSATARSLAEAMDMSDVRLERVLQLRSAIANGTYKVSAADLAGRLLAHWMAGGIVPGRG